MFDCGTRRQKQRYIFRLQALAALVVTLLAGLTASISQVAPRGVKGVSNAFAAGALIAMVVETMIPEATHDSSPFNSFIAVLGFLVILALLGGGV